MNNWRWYNPCAFRDQFDRSNLETTRSGKAICAGERISWYGSDDRRAMIEAPSYWLFKPGDLLAIRRLKRDEIIDEDDDNEHWVDREASSGWRSCPSEGIDNDNG